MSQRVDVVAHIQANAGEEALVREVLESYVAPTRLEKGCLRYDLFVDNDDPSKFTFIEEWESLEDLQVHSRSPHISSGRARVAGKLKGDAWVQRLTQIA